MVVAVAQALTPRLAAEAVAASSSPARSHLLVLALIRWLLALVALVAQIAQRRRLALHAASTEFRRLAAVLVAVLPASTVAMARQAVAVLVTASLPALAALVLLAVTAAMVLRRPHSVLVVVVVLAELDQMERPA